MSRKTIMPAGYSDENGEAGRQNETHTGVQPSTGEHARIPEVNLGDDRKEFSNSIAESRRRDSHNHHNGRTDEGDTEGNSRPVRPTVGLAVGLGLGRSSASTPVEGSDGARRTIVSSISLLITLNETGFVKNRSTPASCACSMSRSDPRPVRATMTAGVVRPRSFSKARMARVASKPFMTGIEMSTTRDCQPLHKSGYNPSETVNAYP